MAVRGERRMLCPAKLSKKRLSNRTPSAIHISPLTRTPRSDGAWTTIFATDNYLNNGRSSLASRFLPGLLPTAFFVA
jgi:hypothetical protein